MTDIMVEDVAKRFGGLQALAGVSFTLRAGDGLRPPNVPSREAAERVMTVFQYDIQDNRPVVQGFVDRYRAAHAGELVGGQFRRMS